MANSQGTDTLAPVVAYWSIVTFAGILFIMIASGMRRGSLEKRIEALEGETSAPEEPIALSSVRPVVGDGLPKWTPRLGGYVHGVWHLPDPKVMAAEFREHFRTKLKGLGEEEE